MTDYSFGENVAPYGAFNVPQRRMTKSNSIGRRKVLGTINTNECTEDAEASKIQKDFSNRKIETSKEHIVGGDLAKAPRARKKRKVFKILVVGNSKCGKTSIIQRYTNNDYSDEYNITIGADYKKKVLEVDAQTQVRLQLWDIAGQDRFANMTRPYYGGAAAAVVVCDVMRPATLDAVRDWKRDLDTKLGASGAIPCIVLANKSDLLEGNFHAAMETGARMENLCTEMKFEKWFITSAKKNENVEMAMKFLVKRLLTLDAAEDSSSLDLSNKQPTNGFKLGNPEDDGYKKKKAECC